ncbi:serine hydrolase [Bacillus carboniphilus]|uniref:Serine hydrolase n=1 Tax=Bacillus carboniphilus TaxID=86663 RepID=A0ABN0VRY7_9BACI
MISTNKLQQIKSKAEEVRFSGALLAYKDDILLQYAFGYSNRSESVSNNLNTRFGIASGCKLFTAIAIGQLVDEGKINFNTRLKDCLDIAFPLFDEDITLHHLLTHTSGIPDYFDEATMDDFADLWKATPMYSLTTLHSFLSLFQNREMMFKPGDKFHYNNAAFIILGLVVEQQSGMNFTQYIEENIFKPCGMVDSGYFSLDQLPGNTALGYIDDEETGNWKTNIYSIPIKGGADGGAFITVADMVKLWDHLMDAKLLSEDNTRALLTPHVQEEDEEYYGYGIWITKSGEEIYKYHVMGYDPGVSFHSGYYPKSGIKLVVTSNKETGAYPITAELESLLVD